ncbi:MAG: DUF3108 domain-containing protein [Ignavibacteriae bacterium]|nr:DUF3108 domain-containing protein [Ignavibacteria bacterium]MBI3364863.1 DUF3108 domain-containing protein [Ignavibacteriota bacterium]
MRFLIVIVALVASGHRYHAVPPVETTPHRFQVPAEDLVFQVGEELTYNVSYAGVDIGQVRVKVAEKSSDAKGSYFVAYAYIDSYKGIPFVDLHTVYQNHIEEPCNAHWFFSRTKDGSRWITDTYEFDYPRRAAYIYQGIWKENTVANRDTLRIDTLYQDGLSLFFYARKTVMTHEKVKIPTLVNRKKGYTHIDFTVERTKEEIDAVSYPVDVVHFEGEAKFVGVFGLTGGFEGWFSNDAARVPILAKMKVIIGNVRIELMKWTRSGWTPPRYVEEKKR